MGGHLGISVRFQDGTQKHLTTGTNSWPEFFQDIDNIPWLDIENTYTLKKWHTPHKSEYGIIFIDYKDKKVTSRQGYCKPFRIMLYLDPSYWDQQDWAAFRHLGIYARNGLLTPDDSSNVTDFAKFHKIACDIPTAPIDDHTSILNRMANFVKASYLFVSFCPKDWTLDHATELKGKVSTLFNTLKW